MFLAHLAKPNWLLSCKFEHHQSTKVKLRSDLVHYCVDTSKNSFFRGFLSQNINSFHLKLPFFILAHLLSAYWQKTCKFERHQSTTVKLRSDLVQYCVETSKNSFFSRFFVSKHKFFSLKVAIFLSASFISKWKTIL